MAPDATPPPGVGWPPLDGRDLSRIRTEVRLAHLALEGLFAEERDTGATHPEVMQALSATGADLESAVDHLGLALERLGRHHEEAR